MNNSKNKSYVCQHCLKEKFTSEKNCKEHYKLCIKNEFTRVKLPKAGSIMKFSNANREFEHPFFVCADFESTLTTITEDDKLNDTNKDDKTLIRYQKHIPNSYGLKYTCIHEKHSDDVKLNTNSDSNKLLKDFIEQLETYMLKKHIC